MSVFARVLDAVTGALTAAPSAGVSESASTSASERQKLVDINTLVRRVLAGRAADGDQIDYDKGVCAFDLVPPPQTISLADLHRVVRAVRTARGEGVVFYNDGSTFVLHAFARRDVDGLLAVSQSENFNVRTRNERIPFDASDADGFGLEGDERARVQSIIKHCRRNFPVYWRRVRVSRDAGRARVVTVTCPVNVGARLTEEDFGLLAPTFRGVTAEFTTGLASSLHVTADDIGLKMSAKEYARTHLLAIVISIALDDAPPRGEQIDDESSAPPKRARFT